MHSGTFQSWANVVLFYSILTNYKKLEKQKELKLYWDFFFSAVFSSLTVSSYLDFAPYNDPSFRDIKYSNSVTAW